MKKKLCFIIPNLGGGGAQRVAFHLLNNLSLSEFELYLIIIYKKIKVPIPNTSTYLLLIRKVIFKFSTKPLVFPVLNINKNCYYN